MSEILGGGCCGAKFRIKLIKVYISIHPLILVATLKTMCYLMTYIIVMKRASI